MTVGGAELGPSTTGHAVFSETAVCALVIPNSLLLRLHDEGQGYIHGVNSYITGQFVTLNNSSVRLHSALRRISGTLATKKRSCKGSRDRKKISEGYTHLLVREGETLSVDSVSETLKRAEVSIQRVTEEKEELKEIKMH